MRVQRLPSKRAPRRGRGKFGHVHLGEDDRSGIAQLRYQERIGWRNRAFEQYGAAGGREVRSVVVVLKHHGNSVKRGAGPLDFAFRIELSCGCESLGIENYHRMKRWPFTVIATNTSEAQLDQRL